jgi:aminoglycoside phosphotransferase family enzyme
MSFHPYAAVRETHSGVVVLLGERALKVKKPVDLEFLDFRSRSSREAACRREVELNRRLAPDVYLGVASLSDVGGGPAEPVVVMRRMPDERRLTTLVRAGAPLVEVIVNLARTMAAFHAAARRAPEISAEGRRDAVRSRWLASFRQVRPFHGTVLDAAAAADIEGLAGEFLAGREALFERRVADARIVDGHGDLICDDIFCLPDGPRILDCLEFDDRLRYLDGLDDIAFLAMDLEHLGADQLACLLLDRYAEFAGDPAPRRCATTTSPTALSSERRPIASATPKVTSPVATSHARTPR